MKVILRNCLKVLGLLVIVGLASCGGDEGGGNNTSNTTTPTDPNQIFSLAATLQSTTLGTIYTTPLTGSDSDGVNYSGSMSMANRAQETLNSILVTPHDVILNLSGGGLSITVTATSYIDTSGNLRSIIVQTTGLVCTPVSPDSMPASVKIGDFGILSTLICDDNTTQELNWRVEDARNGRIRVISSGTTKDQFNAIVSVTDVTFTLDGSGNIVSFRTEVTLLPSNFSMTYRSL